MTTVVDLDRTDRRILDLLAADGRLSMTELADRVNLSRPAAQARVRRLEDRGVIRGYHADIRLPSPTVAHRALLVATFGVRPCAPALAFLRAQPEVRRYWSVAGPQDAVIEVETADAATLSTLIDRLGAAPFGIEAEIFDGSAGLRARHVTMPVWPALDEQRISPSFHEDRILIDDSLSSTPQSASTDHYRSGASEASRTVAHPTPGTCHLPA